MLDLKVILGLSPKVTEALKACLVEDTHDLFKGARGY